MTLPSGLSKAALQYWGTILGASNARLSTAELWQAIDYYEVTNNITDRNITLQDVNRLRSLATSARNSSEALARADNVALDARFIAQAPWQREAGARNAVPIFQVGFRHQTRNKDTGEITEHYRSVMFRSALPDSTAELMAALEQDAAQLADLYKEDHVGISDVSILAV